MPDDTKTAGPGAQPGPQTRRLEPFEADERALAEQQRMEMSAPIEQADVTAGHAGNDDSQTIVVPLRGSAAPFAPDSAPPAVAPQPAVATAPTPVASAPQPVAQTQVPQAQPVQAPRYAEDPAPQPVAPPAPAAPIQSAPVAAPPQPVYASPPPVAPAQQAVVAAAPAMPQPVAQPMAAPATPSMQPLAVAPPPAMPFSQPPEPQQPLQPVYPAHQAMQPMQPMPAAAAPAVRPHVTRRPRPMYSQNTKAVWMARKNNHMVNMLAIWTLLILIGGLLAYWLSIGSPTQVEDIPFVQNLVG